MSFTYTSDNGREITEDISVQQIFDMRWYQSPAPRWMGLHSAVGIPFNRLTAMRRSFTYRTAATSYINARRMELEPRFRSEPTERELRLLGVMGPAESRTSEERVIDAVTENALAAYTTKFGVEIEFLSPVSRSAIEQAVNEAGVTCRDEGYNHRTRTWWKIVHDGSVHGRINGENASGLEIVSPPLTGEEGYRQVEIVCGVLEQLGCKVNRRCGLHVHVESSDLTIRELRNVCTAWVDNEHIIDTLVPASRRGTNGNYCYSRVNNLQQYQRNNLVHEINSARRTSLVNLMCPSGRFYKLNLKALARHGTLEFRYHSGTTSASKVIPHIKFCIGFVTQYKSVRRDDAIEHDIERDMSGLMTTLSGAVNDSEREQFTRHFNSRQRQLAA